MSEFCLINMNGRVYDPVLGQFVQPDNYVQSLKNLIHIIDLCIFTTIR